MRRRDFLAGVEGKDRCATLLNRVKAHAEDKGVTLMEGGVAAKIRAHEWRPTPGRDPLDSLRTVLEIMDL